MAEGRVAVVRRGQVLGRGEGGSEGKSRQAPGKDQKGRYNRSGGLGGSSPVFLSLFPTIAEMDCPFLTVVQEVPLRQGVLPCLHLLRYR